MSELLFDTLSRSCFIFLGWLSCSSGQTAETPKPSPKLPQISRPNLNSIKQKHLPPLSPKQLSSLNTSIGLISQSWLDLAGLGKVNNPPAFPPALQKFRQTWRTRQPNLASFLGQYQDDGQRGQIYSLSIFPSNKSDQVCLVEFSPKFDQGLPDLALPEILIVSKASYKNQQLVGSRLRSARSVILPRVSFNGDRVEFLGIADGQNQPRVFAASGIPKISDDVPVDAIPAINQALKMAGCQA